MIFSYISNKNQFKMATQYLIIDDVNDETCAGLESCEYCSNKVNPSCLEPGELKLDEEEGGGYACTGCAYENYGSLYTNNVFDSVNIGDVVYDIPGKLLGKCFYKSNDGSNTVCLENGRLAIWIKGFCLKQKKGWLFVEGDLKAFYKDCCA